MLRIDAAYGQGGEGRRDLRRHPDGPGATGAPDDLGDLDVPDPWHGGPEGFIAVYDMIERSCRALLTHLRDGGHGPDQGRRVTGTLGLALRHEWRDTHVGWPHGRRAQL